MQDAITFNNTSYLSHKHIIMQLQQMLPVTILAEVTIHMNFLKTSKNTKIKHGVAPISINHHMFWCVFPAQITTASQHDYVFWSVLILCSLVLMGLNLISKSKLTLNSIKSYKCTLYF